MATDPIKKPLNRSEQTKTEKQFNAGIKLYDIDFTIMEHMIDNVVPSLEILGESLKIPVLYGNSERWKNVQKDGFARDARGQIQIPLIMFKRNSIDRDDNISSMMNRHLSYPAQSRYSIKHKYDLFSQMTETTPPLEQYNITMPDYITLTYEVIIWTDFIEQMNKVIESFQYGTDDYWGDRNGFKFRVKIDSFDNTTEISEGSQRIVRTNFIMLAHAYLLPEKFANQPTTKKALTVKKVMWNNNIVSTDATKLTTVVKKLPKKSTTPAFDFEAAYYALLNDTSYDGGGADTW